MPGHSCFSCLPWRRQSIEEGPVVDCRPEMVVGWYHSHPGFGCWLSGVDINTQQVPAPVFPFIEHAMEYLI